MKKIVLATLNQNKVNECQQMLSSHGFNVVSQRAYGVPEAEETGLTFVENALIKARNAAKFTRLPALADDSGLVVPALDGAPGIYSARYAGQSGNDQQNNEKLLAALAPVSFDKRQAFFYCALVYLRHETDPTPIICEGKWHGHILDQYQGKNGFGYDPVFYLSESKCSAASLSAEQKNDLSHRGQALKLMIQALRRYA